MINFKFDIDLNLKGKTKILDKSQIHEILKNFDQFGILRFKLFKICCEKKSKIP